jgi:ABC-type uncharacterized transport system involved in gliding motility auxiliary subunit
VDGTKISKPPGRGALWLNWITVVYTALALAMVLGVTNLIIFDHSHRWDLTPNQKYSLSDFDKRVLGNLKAPVKVMAFIRTEDPSYLELADLLFQIAAYTPYVTYQVIDVNKAPGLARQYGVSSYGEVICESEGRRRDFDNARTDLLIPAILQISHASNKHIYFTVGHGERDLFDTDRSLGFSQWRGLLEQNNYQIDNVSLFAGGVPDDAIVVATLGPRKDFLPEELAALGKFIAKGGHVVAFIDPYGSPSLVKFLKSYGMDFIDQVVVDPAYRLSAGEILTTQIPLFSKDNAITRAMTAPAVLSMARGVDVSLKPGDKAPDGLVLDRSSDFLRSSHESWASGDAKAVTTGITEFQSGRDVKGPITVGAEIDLAVNGDAHVPVQNMARIVGFGSTAFPSNQFIEMLGNRDLSVSLMNEMAGDEILIASRERLNQADTAGFFVTDRNAEDLKYLGAVVEPLLLFAIGAVVFVRRRFFV